MEMANKSRLILIANPGSSSRKYALYKGEKFLASLHFEFEGKKIICTLKDADENRHSVKVEIEKLDQAIEHIHDILSEAGLLKPGSELDAIVARLVAPGEYFAEDHLVDKECLEQIEIAKDNAPLHTPVIAKEIAHFRKTFPELPIVSVSDSKFHGTKPDSNAYYAIDKDLADKYGIKRYGYHGLSVASVAHYMEKHGLMKDKVVVCHVGSGSSVSALYRGKSFDNSMGYSPLEGVMMATRCGNIDVAAALAIKRHLKLDDAGLEKYLNKEAGLLGVSGISDDMRDVETARDQENERAAFSLALYAHKMAEVVGRMAAGMNGVDALVFTATIGERGSEYRAAVMRRLTFLGFEPDFERNEVNLSDGHALLTTDGSKPIWAIKTDEFRQMVVAANELLDKQKK